MTAEQTLDSYYEQIYQRFAGRAVSLPGPAPVETYCHDLSNIRAVIWDLYGTLLAVSVGDLEGSLGHQQRLAGAAAETVEEFNLLSALQSLYPDMPPQQALCEQYLALIDQSHALSHQRGIEYPEVIIEDIWQTILQQAVAVGWQSDHDEPLAHSALRCAYFFDSALQHTSLMPYGAQCLLRLKEQNIVQGIISNAQFYTPIRLLRLLRQELQKPNIQLDDIFNLDIVLFSYQQGYSKPNPGAFMQVETILHEESITHDQILYIGNDMLNDIYPADEQHWKTLLFAGDQTQTRLRQEDSCCKSLKPNAVITKMQDIPELIKPQG